MLPAIYDFKGRKLDDAYMQKHKTLVEGSLKMGGTLPALCLEQVFSKVDKVPFYY
jgi:hypothetical protein